jgi:hypothetical protein
MSSSRTIECKETLSQPGRPNLRSPFPLNCKHTRALDVTDDGSALVVHELDANLGDTTTRTYDNHISRRYGSDAGQRREFEGDTARREMDNIVPVRPRTRVTLTSLTGVFEASIVEYASYCSVWWVGEEVVM